MTLKFFLATVACLTIMAGASVFAFRQADESGQIAGYTDQEVRTLENELASLREQIRLLRRQMAEVQQSGAGQTEMKRPPTQMPAYTEDGAKDELARRGQEEDRLKQRLTTITEQFRAEDIDSKWAYIAEYQLRKALESRSASGLPEVDIACRSTLCRVEVKHDDEARLTALGFDLVGKFPNTFSRGLMHRLSGDDSEKPGFVVYLARKGHLLPNLSKK